jgi:hypothetical protein
MKVPTPLVYICVGLAVYTFYVYLYDGTEYVQSKVDGKFYKVRNKKDKQEKADLLAVMYLKLNTLVSKLARSSYNNLPAVQRLVSNWEKGVTIKEIGKMETDAAYVINKQYMSFCIPENTSKTVPNLNLMTYVGIHELAHIMSQEIGHGDEFISNFEFLLSHAKEMSYFDPLLKQSLPIYIQLNKLNTADNYCGVPLVNSIN